MITNALIQKAIDLHALVEELSEMAEARMDLIARRMNLDEMFFGPYTTTYTRDGHSVESKQLEELDGFRNEHCASCTQLWTKEKGWN